MTDTDDFCQCGCVNRRFERCPDCYGPVNMEHSPSVQGKGYGHVYWVCDSLRCGWWWG